MIYSFIQPIHKGNSKKRISTPFCITLTVTSASTVAKAMRAAKAASRMKVLMMMGCSLMSAKRKITYILGIKFNCADEIFRCVLHLLISRDVFKCEDGGERREREMR